MDIAPIGLRAYMEKDIPMIEVEYVIQEHKVTKKVNMPAANLNPEFRSTVVKLIKEIAKESNAIENKSF